MDNEIHVHTSKALLHNLVKCSCQKTSDTLKHATTTTTVLWPFVQYYPGEPVPEETLIHPPS